MLLTKEIEVHIVNPTIKYFKSLGYDVRSDQKIIIPIEHLQHNSMLKVEVKCDICGIEKNISYQKYNKNIFKYNFYSCVDCSKLKVKMTNKEKYGDENYVNVDKLRDTVKDKYDKITKENEEKGYINCIKCLMDNNLTEYLVRRGRYSHVCKKCRNEQRNRRKKGIRP